MLFTIKLYHDILNCKKWDYTIEIYGSQANLRYCEQ